MAFVDAAPDSLIVDSSPFRITVVGLQPSSSTSGAGDSLSPAQTVSLLQLGSILWRRWRLIVGVSLAAGMMTLGATYLVKPTFTAVTTFLSPQQQGSANSALASFGGLVGLAGLTPIKTPADQYVSLMRSNTVMDQIIDRFKLIELYDVPFRVDARRRLDGSVRMNVGKKDNLIAVEVDDTDPARAADIANAFVEALKEMSKGLALTEAQQRRVFFEEQLTETRQRLVQAQARLQASGFNAGAIKAEPRTAAESFARLKAEVDATEVRLAALRQSRSDTSPEVQALRVQLGALQSQLRSAEASGPQDTGTDYISAYRDFKYQETLQELFAKQFEAAKLDESRDATLFQVIDKATAPERKSKPKRAMLAVLGTVAAGFLMCVFVLIAGLRRDVASI
ncbi:GumC family protein [Roseateles sp. 22389]|uniref:GumC family protein n=1 Tax=Roseateles sp. 22389 TaxID=3453916 RepID=UPI003F85A4A8